MKPKSDKRLIGTWHSDAKRTLAEWTFTKGASAASKKSLQNSFGKFTMRYTAARIYAEFEGTQTTTRYHVLASDDSSVAILRFVEGVRTEIQHIHFIEPDVLWVSCGRNREFFRRV